MAKEFVTPPPTDDELLDITRWPREIAIAINKIGDTSYGNASISPDGNGNGTIAHGFTVTPSYVGVGISGDNAYHVKVQSVDATNITVLIIDSAGADVTSGSYTIYYEAKI